ncbi:MAG TPA: hypothetical protein VGX96_20020 [Candidatus Elarobacter sp.]|nr:hypothetical protein [Candidatus Elarobacter sp.]
MIRTAVFAVAVVVVAACLAVAVIGRVQTTASPQGGGAIALGGRSTIGTPLLPAGDTAEGGHGKPVAGVRCDPMEGARYHVHAHLSVFVNGRQIAVPQNVGIAPLSDDSDPELCYYWLHTHDASGVIHVESPGRSAFVLGDFFRVWGRPLDANRIGPFRGAVSALVDGRPYHGDPARIPIVAHTQITLEVGVPVVAPAPAYSFPPHS